MQKQMCVLAVFCVLTFFILAGCGAPVEIPIVELTSTAAPTLRPPTATAVPATATSTVTPPTATVTPPTPTVTYTPKPTPVLATRPDDILGIWHGSHRDSMYWKFNEDGTCAGAYVRSVLETDPNVICSYTFEGTEFTHTTLEIRGVPPCPDDVSVYQVELLGSRSMKEIRFIKVSDTCPPRVRTMTTGVQESVK